MLHWLLTLLAYRLLFKHVLGDIREFSTRIPVVYTFLITVTDFNISQAMVTSWASRQESGGKRSNYASKQRQADSACTAELPIHKARTEFLSQDVLVPFKVNLLFSVRVIND